jgi:predicted MFS family arabinose efflux permease
MTEPTPTNQPPAERSKRRVTRTVLTYLAIAVVIALVISAILFRQWTLFLLAVVILIPYAFLLLAPIWLARSTQVAQNEREASTSSEEPVSRD